MVDHVRLSTGGHEDDCDPRVVITGIGLITPLGGDRESSWQAIRSGRRAVRWVSWPPADTDRRPQAAPQIARKPLPRNLRIGAPVHPTVWDQTDGNPACRPDELHRPTPARQAASTAREPDLLSLLALRAAHEALRDAGLDAPHHSSNGSTNNSSNNSRSNSVAAPPETATQNRARWGCVLGTSKPGLRSLREPLWPVHALPGTAAAVDTAADATAGWLWYQFQPATPASMVAARFGLQAAALCPVAACATGLVSVLRGAQLIRERQCDVVLAGSTDASLQLHLLGSFRRLGVLARRFESPAEACRPFDARRNGFAVGEGAAVFVLERLSHAEQRGVTPYAEWMGAGQASDVAGLTQLDATGTTLARVVRETLRHSGLNIDEVDYINLHGTATQANDLCETRAIRTVFGPRADMIATSSQKGAIGHLLGAAGSVELACSILALRDGFVPPTMNLESAGAGCDLDYTAGAGRPRTLRTALKISLGFGGHVAVGALRRLDVSRSRVF